MKKLMLVAAATSIAALRPAVLSADGVSSANVVGYQQLTINPGFNMIALNFQPLDGSENISIQDFISNKEDLIAGSSAALSDRIQVWDGTQFTTYFYRAKKTTMPKFTAGPAWVNSATPGTVTTDTIKRGSGVWFARPETASSGSITVSGAINAAPKTHNIAAGFNMISSAFPVDMALNNGPIDWAACGAVAGNSAAASDRIQVWDGSAFTTYYYRAKKTTMPKFTAGPAWVNSAQPGTVTTDVIPAGKGFWYARPDNSESGALVENSPLATTGE